MNDKIIADKTPRKKKKAYFSAAGVFFVLFILLTVAVLTVDVKPVGPEGSEIGLSEINCFVFELSGVNMFWYGFTDVLGYIALLTAFGFVLFGAYQLISRRSFMLVDADIYLLGALYLLLGFAYVVFEVIVINYRPAIIGEGLEASYPSSHTMLTVVIMGSAVLQLRRRLKNRVLRRVSVSVSILIIVLTEVGRLLSGVHWLTDILAGILLGSAMVMLYAGAESLIIPEK